MKRCRVTLQFDVTMDYTSGGVFIDRLKTEMWDYAAKLVRAFNVDNKVQEPHFIARFSTVKIEITEVSS